MNYLLNLFSTNKLAFYAIASTVILLGLATLSSYSYYKGVVNTEAKLKAEYAQLLEQKLKTNTEIMNREFQVQLNAEKVASKGREISKQKLRSLEKSLAEAKQLNKAECDYPTEVFEDLKSLSRNPYK